MVEKIEKVDKDLNQNSEKSECPFLSADSLPPPSPSLLPGWGSQLPNAAQEVPKPPFQSDKGHQWWRPWEMGDMVSGRRRDETLVEERTEAGADHSRNSTECPLLPAAELPPPPHLTPSKAAFSPFYPSPPLGELMRARKKKRSTGELLKRRQRHLAYQLRHTPPSTPSKPSQTDLHWSQGAGVGILVPGDWEHHKSLGDTLKKTQPGFLHGPSSHGGYLLSGYQHHSLIPPPHPHG